MHEMGAELTGTFLGHVIPGAILTVWGLWWFWFVAAGLRRVGAGPRETQEEHRRRGPVTTAYAPIETALKLLVPVAAGLGDLWWASWRLTDSSVLNYQHATAYLGFLLAGVTDLLARRGRVPGWVPHVALAGAFANAGFQFAAHGNHGPLSAAVHLFVIGLFSGEAAVLLLELRHRHPALAVAKAYGLVLHGVWFFHVAWILYRSGWDPESPYAVMRVNLFFTWDAMGVAVGLSLFYALLAVAARGRRRAAAGTGLGLAPAAGSRPGEASP